ncbi:MAG: hypothetical protein ACLU7D_04745 [Collinsella sp.]
MQCTVWEYTSRIVLLSNQLRPGECTAMDYKITGYEPAQLFHFFEEVSAIPRGSGNEKGISDFLVAFAKERGLDVYQERGSTTSSFASSASASGAENA